MIYASEKIEAWFREVECVWDKHWKGRDHRYGRDFAAFVGERLLTDFHLRRDTEGENDTEQRPSTEAGDSDADTERSRSLGAGQISDRVGGRLIEGENGPEGGSDG